MECFTIMSDEIEGRIDPSPYHPIRLNTIKRIKSSKFQLLPLKYVAEFSKNLVTSKTDNLLYVGLENIESNTGVFIPSEEEKESFGTALQFEKGDILFPKLRPYLNKVYLTEFDGVCSTEFHVLKAKKCDKMYLFCFLNSQVVVNQTSYLMTGNTLPRLQTAEVENLLIPIPPEEIQNKIIDKITKIRDKRKSRKTEAQKLLDSINDYVLDELGIKLPELEDKMCFTVNFEDVKTGRIDPTNFIHPQDSPNSNKFKEKPLGEISSLTKGQSITKENITSGDYLVIAGGQSSPYSIDKFNHKGNIITVSASGAYSGYVWYHDYPIFASDCTVIKSLEEKEISTFYLFCVMKAKQKFIYNMQQGAGQPHVYSRDLSKLKIPLPPLSVRNKIAEEVKKRMQKAEQLQKEAKEDLEKAKAEVEKIILGADN